MCDSPSLPSLSLLLAQGTKPTAVCFQQDLLDRAKRTEDEWLPSALKQIKTVTDMRDRAVLANQQAKVRAAPVEVPVILAYSANSALSLSTIEACVAAGASGVLKPLYDLETSKLLRRMVRAARVGRISSVVGLGDASLSSPTSENPEPMVVLPETALRMGGEHEGEKVLSAAMSIHRRAHSGQNGGSDSSPSGRRQESTAPMRMGSDLTRKQSAGQQTSSYLPTASSHATTSPVMAKPDTRFPPNKPDLNYFAEVYRPSLENRRRSVDVSGLCIALCRAQKVFETAASALSVNCAGEAKAVDGYTFPAKPPKKNQLSLVREAERKSTELAELLSAMYYQSTVAIQIEMVEYAE